jgi:hypothetical protein
MIISFKELGDVEFESSSIVKVSDRELSQEGSSIGHLVGSKGKGDVL